ncbi:MAG: branched-chain amino acid ABC transporter permease [Alphaproteobacteria bacterium]
MEAWVGSINYAISLLTVGGIYAVVALGLNVQWGFTGLFNAGIAGFYAIGAYVSAILTTPDSASHLGGFGLPFPLGWLGAMLAAGLLAWGVGVVCIRLRSDYLAIATIGIAEILRLILKNELWLTNGPRGIQRIPRPFESLGPPYADAAYLALIAAVVLVLFLALQRASRSPWGRTMRAIRENDVAAEAVGKNVLRFRLEAFIVGGMLMGLGGAMQAHLTKFIGVEATEPMMTTFLVWVMLIVGGSGNNIGAIVGPLLIWTLWSATELVTARLPADWITRAAYIRIFLVGLLLQVVLQRYAKGLFPERSPRAERDREVVP